MSFPEIDRSRATWWAIGAVLALAFLFVVYSFIGTFVFGIFIYHATRPIYRRIRSRTRHDGVAAAVAIFALVLPAMLLVGYALLIVVQELNRRRSGLDPSALGLDPAALGIPMGFVNGIADPQALYADGLSQYLTADSLARLGNEFGQATQTLAFFGVGAVHLFVMVALAFYLLRDDKRITRWFYSRFGDDSDVLRSFLSAVDADFHGIFFGNILNAVLTGTIGVIAYTLLNAFSPPGASVPAPALVGLLAGVASLIPVVGMKLVYVPVVLLMTGEAVITGNSPALGFVVAFVAVSFVVVDTIPDLVLRPYVSGRSLHVGALMLAYTLGPLLFGWYGIFLMPMLLVLSVHFARIVLPELLAGRPIQPFVVDPTYLVHEVSPRSTEQTSDTLESKSNGNKKKRSNDTSVGPESNSDVVRPPGGSNTE